MMMVKISSHSIVGYQGVSHVSESLSSVVIISSIIITIVVFL